jgi:hypothetical protein
VSNAKQKTKGNQMSSQIQKRIEEIKAEPRALIGTDEGTHGTPTYYRIYEEITGERYAVKSFAGRNGTRWTVEEAEDNTDGRIKMFRGEMARMSALRAELRKLEEEVRNAK